MTRNRPGARITAVQPGSPAESAGIQPGDMLLAVNGCPARDILDVMFHAYDRQVAVTLRGLDGKERVAAISKREGADLGLTFADDLFDGLRRCHNQCVFCFIDQQPPGLRESLYVKDDDERMSLLTGSYITLTNLSERDIDRIVQLRLSPIHVSIHTTNPALRRRMLGHKDAGLLMPRLRRLSEAGIELHGQIVVCPGYNDGDELVRTLRDLEPFDLAGVSLVPVGLTRYRDGLPSLSPVDAAGARSILDTAARFARVYCADELFLKAGLAIPDEDYYDGYPQLENGVGMIALFLSEFRRGLAAWPTHAAAAPFTVVTGTAAALILESCLADLRRVVPCDCEVAAIENRFYGPSVTVAGLVTGGDIIEQLRNSTNKARLLIPANMLRAEGDLFLDGLTPDDLSRTLGRAVRVVPADGLSLIREIANPV